MWPAAVGRVVALSNSNSISPAVVSRWVCLLRLLLRADKLRSDFVYQAILQQLQGLNCR
jgi:hypothetical protein